MSLVKILSRTYSYSPIMAAYFNVECAIAFNYIVSSFEFKTFPKNGLDDFENDTSVNKNIIQELIKNNLLLTYGDEYKLNKNHPCFEDNELDDFEEAMVREANRVQFTVFEDEEFEKLLNKWNKEVIMGRYGRLFSKSELTLKFKDQTFEVAYETLKIAYNNKYTSLNFSYGRQQLDKQRNAANSGRSKIGNGFRSSKGGNGGRGDPGKTYTPPSSTFSERTIGIEE